MNHIILQKDEKRLIGIMLGDDKPGHPELGSESRSRNPSTSLRASKFGMTEGRLDVVLAGENSEIEVVGLLMAKGESQTALEVYITHVGENTKSKVNVRAVLRGKSTFAFRGNVKIEKGAKGADAYLRSDALLFDDAKMGDDTPALEILERDVKAGHAATIGKVDEQMLFYLMSRGITRKQAEKLLIQGFVELIRSKLNDERLRTKA
ncbi:MAG: SufD family Fe-S cluster assembly protein [Patescibacteria group bacterium]